MFTSDNIRTLHNAVGYTAAAAFTALFGGIYEIFSHEVYSYCMIYAFAIPLMCGVLPLLLIGLSHKRQPSPTALRLYNSGIAALTVGCAFSGVLEIYGTTNKLVWIYYIAGAVLVISGITAYALGHVRPAAE